MALYLPEKFDANEIFIIVFTLVTWLFMFIFPKHLDGVQVTLIWTLNVTLALAADFIIGVPPLDLYDTVDVKKYEVFDVIMHFLAYPALAYHAMNHFNRHRYIGWRRVVFVVVCALVTAALEWLAVQFHVFKYQGWKVYYSFFVYITVYLLNLYILAIANEKKISSHEKSVFRNS